MGIAKENKIALLIDADNAQSEFIESMLAEAGKNGKVTIRRIYGNWMDTRFSGWKEQINKFAIKPVQKFSLAKGKNSTDTAMIIDAMDILHSKAVSGFCIASSDGDFTGLAQRIREEGVFVMGIGEATIVPDAFVNACDIFVYTENLVAENGSEIIKTEAKTPGLEVKKKGKIVKQEVQKIIPTPDLPQNKITNEPIDLKIIMNAFDMAVDVNGLAYMGEIGNALRKINPGFDSRTYGSATITNLFKRLPELFELVYQDNNSSAYLKL